MVIGDHIACGSTRCVYAHAMSPEDTVVKIEAGDALFCNVYEHQVWEHVEQTEFAKWFAPVRKISPCGTVLFMARCEPVHKTDLPTHVPAFFTDLKANNFGWYEGRVVCIDYGYHRFIERGMTKKLRKAVW